MHRYLNVVNEKEEDMKKLQVNKIFSTLKLVVNQMLINLIMQYLCEKT